MTWNVRYAPDLPRPIADGGVPSWVAGLSQFPNWTKVALGTGSGFTSGAKLSSCIQSPNSSDPPGGWGHANAVLDSFTGATVDQIRKEYLVNAGGGHADGANNSCFAFALNVEVPYWRRLTDCTPDSSLGNLQVDTHQGRFDDGRPRAMHASNQEWAGGPGITGRVWFPMQSSVTSNNGGHADNVLTFDRDSLGAALTPLPWTAGNIGPWTFWGSSNQNTNSYGFGGAKFDPVTNQIIAASNASGSFGIVWQKIPVTGPNIGVSTAYVDGSLNCNLCWMTICPDLRIVVCGDSDGHRVTVLNIDTNTWAAPAQSGSIYAPFTAGNYIGAVYIPESKSIILIDPKQTGATYYRLQIPMSGSNYNPSGTWVGTTGTMTNYPTVGNGDYNSGTASEWCSSKFNKVEDIGDGTTILVLAVNYQGPTFICKVPVGGI